MEYLAIASFAALLATSYRAERNLLYPPNLFNGTWLAAMVGILLSGDTLYEISGFTYMVYLVGALSISLGGVVGLRLVESRPQRRHEVIPRKRSRWVYRALIVCLAILVVGLPLYWQEVVSVADDVADDLLLQNLRYKAVEASDEVATFGILGNFVVVAQFVAAAMYYELDGSRLRRWLASCAVIVALIYGGMTGTKGNAVVLLVGLLFVSAVKQRKMHVGPILFTLVSALALFSFGLVVINFAYETSSDTLDLFIRMTEAIQSYWLGGFVGFDQIAHDPSIVESTQPIYRFVLDTARNLGMGVYAPPTHAQYLSISPTMDTNTFTIYFSYFKEFGWIGTVVIMFGLGMFLALTYRNAMKGGAVWSIFFANMCTALVFTFHGEHFFLGINGYAKLMVFLTVIYKILPILERRSSTERLSRA